jgi:rhodanese-related sulfurtransferase
MPRDEFVAMMTADLPEAPPYFPMDAAINRRGAAPLSELRVPRLHPTDARDLLESGAKPLDVRDGAAFAAGHLPQSIHIGLQGQFASWAGTLLSASDSLIVVAESEEQIDEAVVRLARVGFENVAGALAGGIAAWVDAGFEIEELPQVSVTDLQTDPSTVTIDVRRETEFASGHIQGAINVPLHELPRRIAELDRSASLSVICQSGYRSSIAASLLQRDGFPAVANVVGGTTAWVRSGLPTAS